MNEWINKHDLIILEINKRGIRDNKQINQIDKMKIV